MSFIPKPREFRIYRLHHTMPSDWSIGRRPSRHIYICFGRFVFTTEPK